ncbi:hypothetical protein HOI18_03365 [Candidatus Uhrbacteria bacterium]|jgi:hypothetical protein|nr:hypothetical protein [Candidatus Uhrbacteria bacterium]
MSLTLALIDAESILFAAALILYGSAFTLSFLLSKKVRVVRGLETILLLILFLLLGAIAIEFSSAVSPAYTFGEVAELSALLSTHRWLLFQLPVLLTLMSLIILVVYRDKIADAHARVYRAAVSVSIAVSFGAMIMIAFESFV